MTATVSDPTLPPVHRVLTPALRRLTQGLRAAVVLAAAGLLAVPLLFWQAADGVQQAAPLMAGTTLPLVTLDTRARLLATLACGPAMAAGGWLLWRLWQLLTEYLAGRVFGTPALGALRGFAAALAVCTALAPLQRTAVALALTFGNPPGQRHLVLSVGSSDLIGLMLAATLWLVASVMAEAARIADDNAGFV